MAAVTSGVLTASTSNVTSYASGNFTPAVGDLLVVFVVSTAVAVASATTVTDSQGLGFTQVGQAAKATNADTIRVFVANALAAATSMSVTFNTPADAGTGAIIFVARVSGMTRLKGGAVRQVAFQSNGAASATPAPAFPVACLTGNPVIGIVANASNPANMTPPSGFTEQGDTGYNTPATGLEAASIDSGFTGTTLTWGGTSGSAFGAIAVELDTDSTQNPVPDLVQHVSHSGTQGNGVTKYNIRMPNPSLAGNCIVVGVNCGAGGSVPTVADDKGNTYTAALANGNSDGNQRVILFVAPNCAAGTQEITVSFGASTTFVSAEASEFYNVNQAQPVDGTGTGSGSGTAISTSAITPTADADLVYHMFIQDTTSSPITSYTKGADPWVMLSSDILDSMAAQYQILASGVTSVTPSATMSPTNSWNNIAVALKAATGGTAPTGMYVRRLQHNAFPASISSGTQIGAPCDGDLLVVSWLGVAAHDITSLTDTNSNTWTKIGTPFSNSDSGDSQMIYSKAPSATTTMKLTVNTSGSDISGSTLLFFDIVGSDQTAPYDSTAGLKTSSGTQTGGGGTFNGASITPTRSGGIVISSIGVASNTVTDSPSGGANFLSSTTTPETSPWPNDENNGWADVVSAPASSIQFAWTSTGGAAGNWANIAVSFLAPAGSTNWTDTLTESFSLSDTLSRAFAGSRTDSEALSFSDALARAARYARSASESFSLTDAVARVKGVARSLSESFSLADVVSRLAGLARSQTEALSFLDAVSRAASYRRSLQESFSLTDAVSRLARYLRGTSESFSLADSVSRAAPALRSLAESLSLTDAVARGASYARLVQEALSFFDAVSGAASGAGSWVRSLSESFSFSDSLSRLAGYARPPAEVFAFADSAARLAGFSRSGSENFTFSDSLSKALVWLRGLTETLSLSDSVSRGASYLRTAPESFSFSDASSRLARLARTLSESFTLADLVSYVQQSAGQFVRNLSEAFTLSDVLSRAVPYRRSQPESFAFADALVKGLARTMSESLSLSDTFVRSLGYLRVESEVLSLADAVARAARYARAEAESFSFVDAVSYLTSGVNHFARSLSEAFSLADVLGRLAGSSRSGSESFSFSESLSKSLGFIRVQSEQLAFSDALSRVGGYARSLSASTSFSDLLTAFNPRAKDIVKVLVSIFAPLISGIIVRAPSTNVSTKEPET